MPLLGLARRKQSITLYLSYDVAALLNGVDLKEADEKIYLIEINDNPSIDAGWEDQILGNELYLSIMRYFYEKIEEARNFKKRSSAPTT